MAIAGLLIMGQEPGLGELEARLARLPGITLYGRAKGIFVVAVLEEPAITLKKRLTEIEELPGVVTAYATYVNIEDETDPDKMPSGVSIA